jgi:hypothetical protein
MKRSVAAAAALVLVTAGRTYPGAGTKKDSPGISRVAETRLLELNRSRWQHPHLRELGGRCSARREGSRVRGRTDGQEHVAAPLRHLRQGTDHRRILRRDLRHLAARDRTAGRWTVRPRPHRRFVRVCSMRRSTRSADSSATRAPSRSTFKHGGRRRRHRDLASGRMI